MTIKLFLILLSPIIILGSLLSYSPYNTHQVLTEQIAEFYNLTTNERRLTAQEIEWMKQGAADEDYPPRWYNHFYNPLTSKGWTGSRLGKLNAQHVLNKLKELGLMVYDPVSSIEWAKNHYLQAREDDYWTWDFGIAKYGEGNYEKAFKTLGHILHLLEDLTVPEHVRDDAHPDLGIIGEIFKNLQDGSPYESWAKEYTLSNYNKINLAKELFEKGQIPYEVSSLEEAFHNLALFVNTNFFSPDTIGVPEFPEPDINKLEINKDLVYYKNTVVAKLEKEGIKVVKEVAPYIWEKVTPELLKYGAGLVKLFLKEAENAKQDADIMSYYIYRTSLTQMGERILSWNIYQTSPLMQIIRFTNSIDKVKGKITLSYYSLKDKFLKKTNEVKEDQIKSEEIFQKDVSLWENQVIENSNLSVKEESNKIEDEKSFKEKRKVAGLISEEPKKILEDKIEISENKVTENKISQKDSKVNKIETLKPLPTLIKKQKSDEKPEEDKEDKKLQDSNKKDTRQPIVIGGGYSSSQQSDSSSSKCKFDSSEKFPKVIINAIKFEGENSKDEFIELYNPNDFEVNLSCWSLVKKTAGTQNTEFSPLVTKKEFSGKIPPYSFFLIVHPSSSLKEKDLEYSSFSYSISKNNVVALLDPNNQIVDLVGFGDNKEKIKDFEKEPFIFQDLPTGAFIERINMKDSDDNSQDFQITKRSPYNSKISKRPKEKIYKLNELANLSPDDFQIFPQNRKLLIYVKEPNFPDDLQPVSNILTFSTSIQPVSLELTYKGKENTFVLDFCQEGNYEAELKIYDNDNELNFVSVKTNFTIENSACTLESFPKILISEVLIGTETNSKDEFIELYNPNDFEIDLSNYKIVKKTSSGSQKTILSSNTQPKLEGKIPPYGYFLITNSSSTFADIADLIYPYSSSKTLADNNTILILDLNNKVIDKLGWGSAKDYEGSPSNIKDGHSLERKVTKDSTSESLRSFEANFGNAYDTDNNSFDFILQPNPRPENKKISKPLPTRPTGFKIKTYFSDLNLEGKYLSWYEKVKKENQIIELIWNQPLINEFQGYSYRVGYKFNHQEPLNYLQIQEPIKDDFSLVRIPLNVCQLKSGPYEFFLEVYNGEVSKTLASTTFFKDPFLFPCPPKAPEAMLEFVNLNNAQFPPLPVWYSSNYFLKLTLKDPEDTDFLATPISWQEIPQYKSFYFIKVATSPELLSDENFFKRKDLWGIDYVRSDSPNNPRNQILEPGQRIIYIDLFDFEKGKTYYLGIKAFSVYDFLYYMEQDKQTFRDYPLEPCKVGSFRARFKDGLINITNNCIFTHYNGYYSNFYDRISYPQNTGIWQDPNFYDTENHLEPIPNIPPSNWQEVPLEKHVQNYPHLLSSTTIVTFTVPEDLPIPDSSRFFKYAKFFQEDGSVYFEFTPRNRIPQVWRIMALLKTVKDNTFTPNIPGEENFYNMVIPIFTIFSGPVRDFPSKDQDGNDLVYKFKVLDIPQDYIFDENDIFSLVLEYSPYGYPQPSLHFDDFKYKFNNEYRE